MFKIGNKKYKKSDWFDNLSEEIDNENEVIKEDIKNFRGGKK